MSMNIRVSARKTGSDSLFVQEGEFGYSKQPGAQEVEVAATVHLAAETLEFRSLVFGLSS
jgi:hypothetical protein